MQTLRDVTVAVFFIAAGFGLDVFLPTWMAVVAGLGAYVGFLVHFARPPQRPNVYSGPTLWLPADEPHPN